MKNTLEAPAKNTLETSLTARMRAAQTFARVEGRRPARWVVSPGDLVVIFHLQRYPSRPQVQGFGRAFGWLFGLPLYPSVFLPLYPSAFPSRLVCEGGEEYEF
jgi:3',5'-cyclic AMP phosphodiesterase CpdA